jgi:hypothetical protein
MQRIHCLVKQAKKPPPGQTVGSEEATHSELPHCLPVRVSPNPLRLSKLQKEH